jgi:lipid A ethanolaminephosphotransferase
MFLKLFSSKKSSFGRSNQQDIHPSWLIVLTSVWIATIGNMALWRELARLPEMRDWGGIWFGISFAALIAALLSLLMSLLCWRWTLKPVIAIFLISTALGGYFMMSYGVVIDSTMMLNVMQTDLRESKDLASWKLIIFLIFLAGLPIAWLWKRRVKTFTIVKTLFNNVILLIASCAISAMAIFPIYQEFASSMRNNIQLRFLVNPLNSFYGLGQLAIKPLHTESSILQAIGLDAKLGKSYYDQERAPLLILVVGETARSGNFGINGYARDTTPSLKAVHADADKTGQLVSFSNAWSCGTSTATALPCMFSHLGKSAYEDNQINYENLIDVLERSGLAVIWLENQSGCKGVCDRIYSDSTKNMLSPELCNSGECFDEIMLKRLTERFNQIPPKKLGNGVVVVMHQMGSHGPAYFKRSPEASKKFKSECATNNLQDCTRAEVINAYDNSIVYTDHFLGKVISYLKEVAPHTYTAMMYVADHGESLGENNIYLHGLPYAIAPDVQKHIPWINWVSNDLMRSRKIDAACLAQQKDKKISHDNYFHSVLGLMDIQTQLYKAELDIFAPCRGK